MTSRSAQKQRTRQRIIQAALDKMCEEESFSSISMREVAKQAGIAPTSFYRHFKDFNELGEVLVEEATLSLRQLVRDAREQTDEIDRHLLRAFVETFMGYLRANPELFRFLMRARIGGSEHLRRSVNREVNKIVREIAELIEIHGGEKRRPIAHPKVLAEAVITILFNVGIKALDMEEEEHPFLVEVIIQQLRMLFLGAELLAERAEKLV